MSSANWLPQPAWATADALTSLPWWVWLAGAGLSLLGSAVLVLALLVLFTPAPRPPRPSEKQYLTVQADGSVSAPQALPCWYDEHVAQKAAARQQQQHQEKGRGGAHGEVTPQLPPAECFMSVVVPAYNEQDRLSGMLEEAVDYLEATYGAADPSATAKTGNGSATGGGQQRRAAGRGWELLVVSDGSTDATVETALSFARSHRLPARHAVAAGPWTGDLSHGSVAPGAIRVVVLEQNRGKGGAVTHGMRHARGAYVVFADADGASRFTDLGRLVEGCEKVKDQLGRAVGVGSRAHMVGTEAVVKRSLLRNTLMRAFHLLIRTLTPARTGAIKDTQCGFKLFSRAALPFIVPYMHSEGWIFDVEMLMLAESAGIPMIEVPVGWKEVMGSKLNVIKDSLGMAIGLAVLRVGWGLGIYRRD